MNLNSNITRFSLILSLVLTLPDLNASEQDGFPWQQLPREIQKEAISYLPEQDIRILKFSHKSELSGYELLERYAIANVKRDLCLKKYIPTLEFSDPILKNFYASKTIEDALLYYKNFYNQQYQYFFPRCYSAAILASKIGVIVPNLIELKIFNSTVTDDQGTLISDCVWKQIIFEKPEKNFAYYNYLIFSGKMLDQWKLIIEMAKRSGIKRIVVTKFVIDDLMNNEVFIRLLKENPDIVIQDKKGNTVLHSKKSVQLLSPDEFKTVAGLFIRNNSCYTPLQHTISTNDFTLLQRLIDKGGSVNEKGLFGGTLLHSAIEDQNNELVQFLLKNGAQVNVQNSMGDTPLHKAVKAKNVEIVQLLLVHQGKVNVKNKEQRTPLHLAVIEGSIELIALLLDSKADIDIRDMYGNTPLNLAIQNDDDELIKLLLERNANVNIQNDEGDTPLHGAVRAQNAEMVKLLLSRGAGVIIENNERKTPLNLAKKTKNKVIIKLLSQIREN